MVTLTQFDFPVYLRTIHLIVDSSDIYLATTMRLAL